MGRRSPCAEVQHSTHQLLVSILRWRRYIFPINGEDPVNPERQKGAGVSFYPSHFPSIATPALLDRPANRRPQAMNTMGPMIKAAVGDTLITFLWVFCASSIDALTSLIASALNAQGVAALSLLITTSLFALLLFTFNLIADAMGGASFNPTGNAAFYAAGHGGDTLLSMALRFPAQAIGAAGGALAIMECMPSQYKHMVGGPSLKVDLHSGAFFEGLLTYIITLAVLWIIIKGPRSPVVKAWMLAVSTVPLIVAGSSLTGPSMNPANAFGWAYLDNRHNTWEQLYVYWITPFIGAILAAWAFKVLFPPTKPKSKKAKKA